MQIKPSIHLLVLGVVWLLLLSFILYGVVYAVNLPEKDPDKVLEIEQKITEFFEKITLPIKIAKLSTKEPDKELVMPVYGLRVSDIGDTWGAPRGDGRVHEGQDFFSPRGTPVFSATNGYVTRITQDSLGGNSVYVTGAGGVRYYYTHLDRFPDGLSVGEEVTTDTIIGFVGNTGNAETTPYHLHFGMYVSREAVDPLPLLKNR